MSRLKRIFHDSSLYQLSSLTRWCCALILVAVLAVTATPAPESEALDLYLRDGSRWKEGQILKPPPADAQPVLFVHGHATSFCGSSNPLCSCEDEELHCEYFRRTWMNSLDNGLRSFADAIDHNPKLNLVPYYINFVDNTRSILEDAREIGEAVERIFKRHNPSLAIFPFHQTPPDVQVAIIAHSKGTISTRVYLKSLYDPLPEYPDVYPGPYPRFHPVSEFIAIAGPNHGTAMWWPNPNHPLALQLWILFQLGKESVQQLNNGYSGFSCTSFTSYPSAFEFMEKLNGHAMTDTHELTYIANGNQFGSFAQEAPGSRKNGWPTYKGPLYVSMFDEQCRDSVGCHRPIIDDCPLLLSPSPFQGRSVAANLAPNAVNIPIKQIDGGSDPQLEGLVAHINIAHHPDTICKALYTVAHHVAAPNLTCSGGNIPYVPSP